MTESALSAALRIIAQVAAGTRRVWMDTPGLIGPANLSRASRSASGGGQAACFTTGLFVLPLGLIVWLALGTGATHAASPPASLPAEVWPVEAAFREAVQLWADEQFEVLWARGLLSSRYRVSREAFVRGMRHRVLKPTCCWGRLRTVRVHLQTAEEALVEAQVGIDVKTLGTTVVRSMVVSLRREEGVWRVKLEDFLTRPEEGLPGPSW
ncbi:MAG TPA: hypothetical protein VLK82_07740 [Candidatus Tectomicrobia bacterium]|nr:hypothetical protein [Candidatus Tectomicrobia bacterium]